MSLLVNAVTSLHLALEDYSSSQDARLLSAVRNLHAGILLLYKEKLRLLSPSGSEDVLLKANSQFLQAPGRGLICVGVGKRTVGVSQIRERFKSLGVQTHWDRFGKVNDLRNDIEHYFTSANRGAIAAMISDTFLIIRDFIHQELGQDPKVLLGDEAWAKLISVSEVVEKEREFCQKRLAAIDWESGALAEAVMHLTCAECGSPLLSPLGTTKDTKLQCRSCGEDEDFESYAERAISEHFADDNFRACKEGGDPVSTTCPHCGQEGYIVAENRCVLCEETCETTCSVCGSEIPIEELSDGSLCGYCDHMLSKDD